MPDQAVGDDLHVTALVGTARLRENDPYALFSGPKTLSHVPDQAVGDDLHVTALVGTARLRENDPYALFSGPKTLSPVPDQAVGDDLHVTALVGTARLRENDPYALILGPKTLSHVPDQAVGDDLHVTALVGAARLREDGPEYGIEAGWAEGTPAPAASKALGARCAQALAPTRAGGSLRTHMTFRRLLCWTPGLQWQSERVSRQTDFARAVLHWLAARKGSKSVLPWIGVTTSGT